MKAAYSTVAVADIMATDEDVDHVLEDWPDVDGENTCVECFRDGEQTTEQMLQTIPARGWPCIIHCHPLLRKPFFSTSRAITAIYSGKTVSQALRDSTKGRKMTTGYDTLTSISPERKKQRATGS